MGLVVNPARSTAAESVCTSEFWRALWMGRRGNAFEEAAFRDLDEQEVQGDHADEHGEEVEREGGETEVVGER